MSKKSLTREQIRKLSGNITLTKEGEWLHDGQVITHARTKELLFKSVDHDGKGYFLRGEKVPVPITVEDVAFFVKSVRKNKSSWKLTLSDGSSEDLEPKTLYFNEKREPNCLVKEQRLPARLERKVYYEVMKGLVSFKGYLGLKEDGVFYPMAKLEDLKEAKKAQVTKKKAPPPKKSTKKKASQKKTVAKKKSATKKRPVKKKAAKKATKKSLKPKKAVKKKKRSKR